MPDITASIPPSPRALLRAALYQLKAPILWPAVAILTGFVAAAFVLVLDIGARSAAPAWVTPGITMVGGIGFLLLCLILYRDWEAGRRTVSNLRHDLADATVRRLQPGESSDADRHLLALLDREREDVGLSQCPTLYLTSPGVRRCPRGPASDAGLFQGGSLFLPETDPSTLDRSQLRAVVRHELAHIVRRDAATIRILWALRSVPALGAVAPFVLCGASYLLLGMPAWLSGEWLLAQALAAKIVMTFTGLRCFLLFVALRLVSTMTTLYVKAVCRRQAYAADAIAVRGMDETDIETAVAALDRARTSDASGHARSRVAGFVGSVRRVAVRNPALRRFLPWYDDSAQSCPPAALRRQRLRDRALATAR